MRRIWNKLKCIKQRLKTLNIEQFKGVEGKLKHIRNQLREIQERMGQHKQDSILIEEEKKLRRQLETWGMIEESIYKQKSRVQWLKVGDSNSAYFFANMTSRYSQNNISSLSDEQGVQIQAAAGIKTEVIGFFKKLLGTAVVALPAIYPAIIRDGLVLLNKQQRDLIRSVTSAEVFLALKDIDDMKARGCDGLNRS
ncbi:uncharacterized protein [Nicotiana sylvestris]|uniref:Uncharacterized protein LOC104216602 n=1 Tax=Nicotiana sylvestris TaxID=4096 RepID=A0A1U7VAE3_NICSY|nr:PREDICTED: uncharacterized protein LOC104216602 [Nicotiana sylvestris]